MLKPYLTWWGRHLWALIPRGLQGYLATAPRETILALHELPGERSGPFALRLPGHLALEKRLTLPAAAERELPRIIGYEMDRETPFTTQEVYWQAEIASRDAQRRQIVVRLILVPCAALAAAMARLDQAGIRPAALLVEDMRIPIDREARQGHPLTLRQVLLPVACAALILLAVALPFIRQGMAISEAEDRIVALTPEVAAVAKFRRALGQDDAQSAIAAQRRTLGDPLAMLAAVTRALPDDTDLSSLSYTKRVVTLSGQSSEAPALIRHLASDPAFKGPSFAAPIIRAADSSRDSFSIAVTFAAAP